MSYVTSPVTQVAEVEVKRALIYGVHSPFADANGNDRRKLPRRIIPAKPRSIVKKGDIFFFILYRILYKISLLKFLFSDDEWNPYANFHSRNRKKIIVFFLVFVNYILR